jgi:maltose alpha-D-glucosyltransferase/alpha-amylase
MRVLLDLVAGHTSEEHPWFIESQKASQKKYRNRYIWTNYWYTKPKDLGCAYVSGESERSGVYVVNFFKCQPALNYGFLNPAEPWQLPMNHPDCISTKEALIDVMRFWLGKGCDGFRVDMAFSLVKGDNERKTGTCSIWREVRAMLDREYPEAALISEWGSPELSIPAGFHMDFFMPTEMPGYKKLIRNKDCFFKKNGSGDITPFLDEYMPMYVHAKNSGGYLALVTGNTDLPRAQPNLTPEELALGHAFILTMPGTPFLCYGDEIGMRYLDVPSKEGGYDRTGSRTPMQWSQGKNLGFSSAEQDALYLPVDPSPDAPTVEEQEKYPSSLLKTVRALLRLRRENPDLQSVANLEIIYAGRGKLPVVYKRGSFYIAINPSGKPAEVPLKINNHKKIFALGGCELKNGLCRMGTQSFGIWKELFVEQLN